MPPIIDNLFWIFITNNQLFIIQRLFLLINVVFIIMFVLSYVYFIIFLNIYCNVITTIKIGEKDEYKLFLVNIYFLPWICRLLINSLLNAPPRLFHSWQPTQVNRRIDLSYFFNFQRLKFEFSSFENKFINTWPI